MNFVSRIFEPYNIYLYILFPRINHHPFSSVSKLYNLLCNHIYCKNTTFLLSCTNILICGPNV